MRKIFAWIILIYSVFLIAERPENLLGIRTLFGLDEDEYMSYRLLIEVFMIAYGYYLLFKKSKKIKHAKKIKENENKCKAEA